MRIFLIFLIILISAAGYFAVQEALVLNPQNGMQGNALAKYDVIQASSPESNSIIQSPVLVTGKARGGWFFEADFPVRVLDSAGNELGVGIAHALSDWMTEEFVPFQATVQFEKPTSKEGFVVLGKDNPSGLPEHADELRIPVRFHE